MDARTTPNIPTATIVTLAIFVVACLGLGWIVGSDLPELHAILDTAMFVLSGMLALVLWDMGQRLDRPFKKHLSITFAAVCLLEFLHGMVSVEWSGPLAAISAISSDLRPLTWPAPAVLLPLGVAASLWLLRRGIRAIAWFAIGVAAIAIALFFLFQNVAPYSPPNVLGMTRPSLLAVPLLWAGVLWFAWHTREADRAIPTLGLLGVAVFIGSTMMLYSRYPPDTAAIIAHLSRVAGYLALLFSLMHMASHDMLERVRAEAALARINEDLERRVAERTAELGRANAKAHAQLERLALLHQISRAIGERQDIDSIFQVAVRSIEEQMPTDFVCLCLYDAADNILEVARVGIKSGPLALALAMPERTRIEIDANGLSRCVKGALVYEPDIANSPFPFPQRLAGGGLRAFVAAPLQVESQVFGALIVARAAAAGFESGECEFLRQLSEHVALASNQAQLTTALQVAYDELRQTQDAVMQHERLRALGQMASGIAHDINNALSPIGLYTESLLATEPSLTEAGRGKLEIMQRAIDDAAHTVSRMKDFYRQRETQLELRPVDAGQLIGHAIALSQSRWKDMALERGDVIEVKTELAPELPPILGVESELRDALVNLVFNAVDALPNGGVVILRARSLPPATANAKPDYVVIEVADNGVGMDEETSLRCLEPFFTTKGERGTGLGLASVYGVVQRHGGGIAIESELGKGTKVVLTFAAAQEPSDAEHLSTASPRPHARLRLLLIDDDPILLRSLRDVLMGDGHVIATASDGAAGVAAFRDALEQEKAFDAVITDLGMPKLDGRRVAASIKEVSPATPVVLLTGWGERLMVEAENPPHIDRVLSKPPKLRELRAALAMSIAATGQTNSA